MYTIVNKLLFPYQLFYHIASLMTILLELPHKWRPVQPDETTRQNEPHATAAIFKKSDALDRIPTI